MTVGLILVSHSRALADGTAELARQMAPAVGIHPAGGTDDGGLGTSFEAIAGAITAAVDAADGAGVVLLYDLGSALLSAETALEFAGPEVAALVSIVDAPLVEGAVAAAVAAQGGGDLGAVARAAASAREDFDSSPGGPADGMDRAGPESGQSDQKQTEPADEPQAHRTTDVVNPLGLHARPVATLVRALAGWDATVSIGRVGQPAVALSSVLRVVSLALRGGERVEITGRGPDASDAVRLVATLIAGGFGELDPAGPRISRSGMGAAPARLGNAPTRRGRMASWRAPVLRDGALTAVPGAPGLAMGPLVLLDRAPVHLPASSRAGSADGAAGEGRALDDAIRKAGRKLALGNQFEAAHAVLLADPDLRAEALARLSGTSAGAADVWWSVVTDRADALAAEPDELVAARAVDLREAGAAVLAELGVVVDRIPADLGGAIVVTDDLGPGDVPILLERGAAGVVLSRSSATAHAVIVARGLALPMVLRAGDDLARVSVGTPIVLDGDRGTVLVAPDEATVDRIRRAIATQQEVSRQQQIAAAAPVLLADGRRIMVVANVGSLADARAAVRFGADGVGLLRTELLVLDRETYPDEDTQVVDMREIFEVLGDLPMVVRVLDAGGDKPVTALDLDVAHNGFLGVRGLRYLLVHPEVLHTQLRAIFRAAVGHRVSVMAPMVTMAREVVAFREAVNQALDSLAAEGVAHQRPEQIGVMVEVPAAALAADEFCAVADFLSVGSNDLTSYTMAADRTETDVAEFLDPGSTAVQRLLDQLCEYAAVAGTPVAVCGEIAGMAEFAPSLVARGVHELSVAPARIPAIKELLRGIDRTGMG